ncbi:hypothetical protein RDABS01_019788 [Bienertia sinuspersici]
MKAKTAKRKPSSLYKNKAKKNSSNNSKRRRQFDSDKEGVANGFNGEIESEISDSGDDFFADENGEKEKEDDDEEDELEKETVEERRRRLAWDLVEKVRKGEQDEEDEEDDDDEREEKEGNRDSLVAKILQQEQLEESGRVRRLIASKLQKPKHMEEPRLLLKHRQSVTAVALSDDDRRGFSASKDGYVAHWDVEAGKAEKYLWPSDEVLKLHELRSPAANLKKTKGRTPKHSKSILALAVSSDGRFLATGGLDRHVHLWDTRTREHIQALPGHRGPVSCLAFRQGTAEIFAGSFDRTLKIWNAEDCKNITTLFGHQSEVLSMDCLRKERVLTVGRDRTMQLYKVPEESRLIYRASTSSLECCCFVGNDEFLSGSDDGSIELWSALRKKPVSIVKNAHTIPLKKEVDLIDNGRMANGHIEGSEHRATNPCSTAQSWVSSVTVCRNSDLAASGAGNGCVRLWKINSDNRGIEPLFDVPLEGYVNSMAIAKSGRFLVAGVGQEPRLGRWDRISAARNGVALQSFKLTS